MNFSKLPAFRLLKRHLYLVVVVGLCATLQAIGADAHSTNFSSGINPVHEAAEEGMRKKYIKRLKPADPESNEAMLAGRGLDGPDRLIVLS